MKLLVRSNIILVIFFILFIPSSLAGTDEWPGWRGLNKQACSDASEVPVEWTSSEHILWKVNIEGEGYSSPVADESSVFITSARFTTGNIELNKIIICFLLIVTIFLILRNSAQLFSHLRINDYLTGNGIISVFVQLAAYGLLAFSFIVMCWMFFNENRSQGERILISYFFSGSVVFCSLFSLIVRFPKDSSTRIIAGIVAIISVPFLVKFHPIPEFYFSGDFFRITNLWIFQLIVPAVILPGLFSLFLLLTPVFTRWPGIESSNNLKLADHPGKITLRIRISAIMFFLLGLTGFMAMPAISLAKWINRDALTRIQAPFGLNVFINPEYSFPFFLSVISIVFFLLFLTGIKAVVFKPEKKQHIINSAVLCSSLIFFAILNLGSNVPVYTREIICIDRYNGKIKWKKECETSPAVSCSNYNSQATPTPLIDDNNIYAYFGSAGLFSTDKKGSLKWRNTDLPYESIHGVGGSPVLCSDGIVLLNSMAKNPYLTLLDRDTGAQLWKTNMSPYGGVGGEYRTPLIFELNGEEVIIEWSTARASLVIYSANTGMILYQYNASWALDGESISTPVISDGIIFLPTRASMVALDILKLTRNESPILWISELSDKGPDTSSPILVNGMLFMVSDNGIATCMSSKTGEIIWQEKLKGTYFSSPVSVGERIYFSNSAGMTTVVQCSPKFRILNENSLPEGIYATLVPVNGQLFIRTKSTLWCIK